MFQDRTTKGKQNVAYPLIIKGIYFIHNCFIIWILIVLKHYFSYFIIDP